jgi:hypothetical protein
MINLRRPMLSRISTVALTAGAVLLLASAPASAAPKAIPFSTKWSGVQAWGTFTPTLHLDTLRVCVKNIGRFPAVLVAFNFYGAYGPSGLDLKNFKGHGKIVCATYTYRNRPTVVFNFAVAEGTRQAIRAIGGGGPSSAKWGPITLVRVRKSH